MGHPPQATPDRYELLARLGQGGMGVVYKARDKKLHRLVAIKFLSAKVENSEEARVRFEREARAISALHHPNIAIIHDVELEADQPYLVLEYLGGGTLRARTRGRLLELPELLSYGKSIAAGLAHAHRHGIVHRDLKPSNALFDGEGRLKIADFGLAKALDNSEVTTEGLVVGTVAYMSPEQASAQDVDPRSDIFSLGVILYELAAGRQPFRGDHPSIVLSQILSQEPMPLHEIRPDLPPSFVEVVNRALEKKPERRFQRMEDVEYALDTLAHEPGASSVLAELDQQTRTQSPASVERHTNAVSALTARLVPKKWQPALLGALALFLVLAVAPLGSISRWLRRTALPAERRVAVLPFQSSAGDPQGEMFASGLTEMVANLLSQSERFQTSLAVVPTSEVKRQNVKTVTDAYSTFNVNLTLTGTVLGTGAERQIGLTLVQTSPMKQVAARVVKAPAGDTRSLESNLLGAVLELLDLDMSLRAKDLVTASRASSPGAQDLYLRAQGELRDAVGLDAADRAIPLLQEATRLDAKYALAWCALTEAYLRRFVYTHNSADLALADQAADKAYAAGPRLAQAHYTQATVRRATGRYEEAIQALRKGLELDSTDYDSHRLLAGLLDQTGQVAEAEAEYKLAVRLKPSFWPTYVSLGTFYYSHGKMQQAEEALRTAVQLAPNNDRNRRNLGSLYLLLGKQKEGEAELRASLALKPSAPAYSNLGAQEFFHGNFGEAARLFEEATKLDPNDAISWGQLGEACLELPARRSEAAGHLKKAIQLAERQLEINPRQAQLVSSVAVYQAKLGQNGVALERVRTAMDLAPQDGRVMIKAARVFEIAKRRSDAVEMLRKAVALGLPLWEIEGNRELETVRKDPKFLSATMK